MESKRGGVTVLLVCYRRIFCTNLEREGPVGMVKGLRAISLLDLINATNHQPVRGIGSSLIILPPSEPNCAPSLSGSYGSLIPQPPTMRRQGV